jgi:predicted Zn finger-like uncharacterized protein
MIVTCEKCNTGFDLDEDMIRDEGSEVKCSECQHVFTVHKSGAAIEPEPQTGPEGDATDVLQAEEEQAEEEFDVGVLGLEEETTPEETPEAEAEVPEEPAGVSDEAPTEAVGPGGPGVEEETDMEALFLGKDTVDDGPVAIEEEPTPEEPPEAEAEVPEEPAGVSEEAPEEEALDIEEPGAEGELPTEEIDVEGISRALDEMGLEEVTDEMGAGLGDATEEAPVEVTLEEEAPEEVPLEEEALDFDLLEEEEPAEAKPAEAEADVEEFGLDEEELVTEEPAPVEVEEEVTVEEAPEPVKEEVAVEEAEVKEEPAPEPEPVEEEFVPPPVIERKPPARKGISTPIIVVLVLGLLAGGGVGAYFLLEGKIPFLESIIGEQKPAIVDPGNLRVAVLEQQVKGEFVDNSTIGRVFVIKGMVRNDYPQARSFIRVKAVLYSQQGAVAKESTSYCGNVLSNSDLQTIDKTAMDARLRNRFGDDKSNFNIPSGKVIPFMVSFYDLPQDFGEFGVQVVSSLETQ